MGTLAHSLARDTGNTAFAFLTRESDNAVYDNTNSVFVENQQLHLTNDQDTRSHFRISYTEIKTGLYRLEIDVTNFLDGNYTVQSRFLDSNIESLPIDVVSLVISGGEVQDGAINIEATLPAGLNIFAYIKDAFTGTYLKSDMSGFSVFYPLDALAAVRANFRHSFTGSSKQYLLNKSLATIEDTVLEVSVYNLKEGVEYKAGSPVRVHVSNNKQQRGVLFTTVLVDHNTPSPDNLQYVADNGAFIEGADVYIFKQSEYTSGVYDNAVGRTKTDSYGRWVDSLPVEAGNTYVVVLFKPYAYGPDNTQIQL